MYSRVYLGGVYRRVYQVVHIPLYCSLLLPTAPYCSRTAPAPRPAPAPAPRPAPAPAPRPFHNRYFRHFLVRRYLRHFSCPSLLLASIWRPFGGSQRLREPGWRESEVARVGSGERGDRSEKVAKRSCFMGLSALPLEAHLALGRGSSSIQSLGII